MSSAGSFKIHVSSAGYPVWCTIKRGSDEIMIHHNELSDLKYAVEKAMLEARAALPDRLKSEV